jgi:mono/diheme cytochrome c family protein
MAAVIEAGSRRRLQSGIVLTMVTALTCAGCSQPSQFGLNEVELLKLRYQHRPDGEPFSADQTQSVVDVLAALFGTPDEPRFPYVLGPTDPARDLINLDYLRTAAGPVSSDRSGEQVGLYREHCAQCHGINGDGAGPTAAFLNPYPRDFRLGKFKYKSTKLGQMPTDDDLNRIIVDGIPGSAMPSFRTLKADEIAALVDYVKYLVIRGRVESKLLAELALLDPDESLIDLEWRGSQPTFDPEPQESESDPQRRAYDDQLALIVEDIFLEAVAEWDRRQPTPVPEIPSWLVDRTDAFDQHVEQGRRLFVGRANCAMCHGMAGHGDGQTENYDDWTNQWVKGASVDPRSMSDCRPFLDAGAFPPRPIRPRNLRLRVYRGGDRLSDLYRRIANGIEGTGMPDSSVLTEEEIWSLVAYVLNLPYESNSVTGSGSQAMVVR